MILPIIISVSSIFFQEWHIKLDYTEYFSKYLDSRPWYSKGNLPRQPNLGNFTSVHFRRIFLYSITLCNIHNSCQQRCSRSSNEKLLNKIGSKNCKKGFAKIFCEVLHFFWYFCLVFATKNKKQSFFSKIQQKTKTKSEFSFF